MNTDRQYTQTDEVIKGFSRILDTLFVTPSASRSYPGISEESSELSTQEQQKSMSYMRVNHVGEICAQALYQSQAITAKDSETREQMKQAADEEVDHLAWCEQRIEELGGRKSILNPLWYGGAFAIGTLAGIAGDKWNLGFVAETERQVVEHLEGHLGELPENDLRSREVVAQMKEDEASHAEQAVAAGAAELPNPIKQFMRIASKVMIRTAYWV